MKGREPMNIIENISEEELTSVVTKLFERVDNLDSAVNATSVKAEAAMAAAKAAKEGLKSIKKVPTNGWDVLNHSMDTFSNILGTVAAVACVGFGIWIIYKMVTIDYNEDKGDDYYRTIVREEIDKLVLEGKIKIE